MEDLNEAGGVYAVMNELSKKNLLNLDCMTVTGKTVGENIKNCINKNPEVIRTIDNPYSQTGGIAILKGNLAPDSGVVKRPQLHRRCWYMKDRHVSLTVRRMRLQLLKVARSWQGDVVVIRYEGPKGGPGMREMLNPTSAIAVWDLVLP